MYIIIFKDKRTKVLCDDIEYEPRMTNEMIEELLAEINEKFEINTKQPEAKQKQIPKGKKIRLARDSVCRHSVLAYSRGYRPAVPPTVALAVFSHTF